MSVSLADLLPDASWDPSSDVLLDRFLQYTHRQAPHALPGAGRGDPRAARGQERHPEHADRLRQIAGRVGDASSRRSRAGQRAVYTCPIKALVNEKWMALCREFGPDSVGLSTGDATVNRDAPILCCTAEILANIALREGADADVARRRDGRVPLLRRPRARRRLAGAAADDAAGALPADVGDARRHARSSRRRSRG